MVNSVLPEATLPKTVLVLASNPAETDPLRLGREIQGIRESLLRSRRRREFRVEDVPAATLKQVRRAMLEHRPAVVHFCGHGAGSRGLVFEDDDGNAVLVDGKALASFFELFRDHLECVVLNACYSDLQAKALARHVPWVVGMRPAHGSGPKGIVDEERTALDFAVAFYDGLWAGRSYRASFD